MLKAWRYWLVFPDGLIQELDEDPQLEAGGLLGAERAHISEGSVGKYVCTGISTSISAREPGLKCFHMHLWEPTFS